MKRQESSKPPSSSRGSRHSSKFQSYTPLNVPRSNVLKHIREKGYVSWSEPMQTPSYKRNMSKYCQFHRDHGLDTEECIHLKNEIEALIKKGHLSEFVKKGDHRRETREQKKPEVEEKENGGDSGGAQKRYAKQVLLAEERKSNGKKHKQDDTITFNEEDEEGVQQSHGDALVVSLLVTHYKVRWVLIDNGSLANIIFWSVLQEMKIGKERLKSISTPLVGFGGDVVHPMGMITLLVTMGTSPQQITLMEDFLVVNRL
ncbi:uncharacterized protein LOC131167426 [Malania oleifera]|uniref:uncharacterized protein LOC131167426 n=1 Tax=Malania oleifera TaxID=397392 RepID=UPI0025AEC971|nr:uncharacterized protein LOC131167426 [Malania oleifera]